MDYKEAVQQAHQQLKQSVLAKPHVLTAFNKIKWTKSDDAASQITAQLNTQDCETINLYPALLKLPAPVQAKHILREFGLSLFKRVPEAIKHRWEFKLCLPEKGQMDSIQGKLASPEHGSYRELTDTFKTAMDRLVCLNVCNGLLANGVARGQSRNLNITQYGATAEYACLKRYHSVKPLVSAYADRRVCECPGEAFSELVTNGLRNVRESSVGDVFRTLTVDVFMACR